MKKIILILASLLAFMFIGCGGGDSAPSENSDVSKDNSKFSFTPPAEDIEEKTVE